MKVELVCFKEIKISKREGRRWWWEKEGAREANLWDWFVES